MLARKLSAQRQNGHAGDSIFHHSPLINSAPFLRKKEKTTERKRKRDSGQKKAVF